MDLLSQNSHMITSFKPLKSDIQNPHTAQACITLTLTHEGYTSFKEKTIFPFFQNKIYTIGEYGSQEYCIQGFQAFQRSLRYDSYLYENITDHMLYDIRNNTKKPPPLMTELVQFYQDNLIHSTGKPR